MQINNEDCGIRVIQAAEYLARLSGTSYEAVPSWLARRVIANWIIHDKVVDVASPLQVAEKGIQEGESTLHVIRVSQDLSKWCLRFAPPAAKYLGLSILRSTNGSSLVHVIDAPRDGSCFYHCAVMFVKMCRGQDYSVQQLKDVIVQRAKEVWNETFPGKDMTYSAFVKEGRSSEPSIGEYESSIMRQGHFGGVPEARLLGEIFSCTVEIFYEDPNNTGILRVDEVIRRENHSTLRLLTKRTHYFLLAESACFRTHEK